MAKLTLEQLGSHLKSQRGNRGLREIAAEIGISAATLSRVEAGKQPDLDSFRKICEWLGEDPGKFLGYKGKSDSASSGNETQTMLAHFKADKAMSLLLNDWMSIANAPADLVERTKYILEA